MGEIKNRPIAVITGASSGIGVDLARLFAEDGHDLALIARSVEPMRQLAAELQERFGTRSTILQKDLSVPNIAGEVYREVQQIDQPITALVNNAGVGLYGFFSEQKVEEILNLLNVNLMAVTHLTRLFLPEMIRRKAGRILNIASTAAFQPGPLMAIYFASKSYVLSFSEALANELRETGVTVTALCPGPTRTGFQNRAYMESSRLADGQTLRMMNSRDVAQAGYDGMLKGKAVVIPGRMNRILALAARLGPRSLVTSISRSLQEKK